MLFDSTVRKELARSFGATLVVLLTIVLTMMLIRTLGLAANGVVSPQDVVLLLGFIAIGNLPTILALSLFVAIVVSLGRMYRDSEMAIWFASGVGLARFVRPVLHTSWPVLVVIAGLVLVAWPWSNRQQNDLRQRYEQRSDALRATPGQFQASADGRRVFFVEKEGAAGPAGAPGTGGRNVFIVSETQDRESVASSQSGRLASVAGERFLMLDVGHMQQVDHKSGDFTHVVFEHYKVRAGESSGGANGAPSPKMLDTQDLVETPTAPNLGELVWRLGLVFGATNLLLIGLGLAATNPRRASNWSLLFALLAFIIYYNMLNLTQAWVSSGRMHTGLALLGLHGAALVFAVALIWWRDHANVIHPLRKLMFWRRPA
jgi:lipopolysaccharide export system permease protein